MADVKVSALTALTGANLANGDQFLVTDVGSPNVSKSITADELAQGSQFSSRFVSQADQIRIDLGNQHTINQSTGAIADPVTIGDGSGSAAGFIKTTPTAQGIMLQVATPMIPTSWTTMNIKMIYSIQTASTDDVVFRAVWTSDPADGTALSGSVGNDVTTDLTGLTAYHRQMMTLASGAATSTHEGSTRYFKVQVARRADQAGDTASTTVYGHQLIIEKAS